MKQLAIDIVAATLLASVGVITPIMPAAASPKVNALHIKVDQPLVIVTATPLPLIPAFSSSITDYVLHCQPGVNTIQVALKAGPGDTVQVGRNNAKVVAIPISIVENQALVITAKRPRGPSADEHDGHLSDGDIQYWIRCLPHDFPELKVNKPGNPTPGWYLTGNIFNGLAFAPYAMVLDNNGTPVWYRRSSGPSALNITALSDHLIAWATNAGSGIVTDPTAAYEVYNLKSQSTSFLRAPIPPTDFHELQVLPNGDLMTLSSPLQPNIDMTSFGLGLKSTVIDCLMQEVNPAGNTVWSWRASDHLAVGETVRPPSATTINGEIAYDLFHCNSVDVDPQMRSVLMSARHTDAVYLIDRSSGRIMWKMGGNALQHDNERILRVVGDPDISFHAQHDARFQPRGDISLYDDESWDPGVAARGVVYHIDNARGTANLVWSFAAPDGHNSAATGSFRRLNRGTDNVIAWGVKNNTLFTEVDAAGNVMLNVELPSTYFAYRVAKLPPLALDHDLLRATAGLAPLVALSS